MMKSDNPVGRFTFRTAAVFFVVSAVFELMTIAAEVPLFGVIQGGIVATVYHICYAGLFLALGLGLWNALKWGYPLVLVTTAVYTVDKLQLMMNREVAVGLIQKQMSGYEELLRTQGIDDGLIWQGTVLVSATVILCWWGFALFTYWRRAYFNSGGS